MNKLVPLLCAVLLGCDDKPVELGVPSPPPCPSVATMLYPGSPPGYNWWDDRTSPQWREIYVCNSLLWTCRGIDAVNCDEILRKAQLTEAQMNCLILAKGSIEKVIACDSPIQCKQP